MKHPIFAAAGFSTLVMTGAAIAQDATAFATGNMSEAVKSMDANHDGLITKEEFLKYEAEQFDKMQKTKDGMVTADDMLKYLRSPGNTGGK
jgi:Ca2+-binding EF-hand superfamily protein